MVGNKHVGNGHNLKNQHRKKLPGSKTYQDHVSKQASKQWHIVINKWQAQITNKSTF